jgi:hypothetical protein
MPVYPGALRIARHPLQIAENQYWEFPQRYLVDTLIPVTAVEWT